MITNFNADSRRQIKSSSCTHDIPMKISQLFCGKQNVIVLTCELVVNIPVHEAQIPGRWSSFEAIYTQGLKPIVDICRRIASYGTEQI